MRWLRWFVLLLNTTCKHGYDHCFQFVKLPTWNVWIEIKRPLSLESMARQVKPRSLALLLCLKYCFDRECCDTFLDWIHIF